MQYVSMCIDGVDVLIEQASPDGRVATAESGAASLNPERLGEIGQVLAGLVHRIGSAAVGHASGIRPTSLEVELGAELSCETGMKWIIKCGGTGAVRIRAQWQVTGG
ncbi:MAG: hypothetical protein DHS20C15_12900 [Planctomycetota bacterium]|nr:MAG: hypothetical protein DHS20C15_12900 [Planctomycetota bacterium]